MDAVGADEGLAAAGAGLAVGLVDGNGDAAGMGDHVPITDTEDDVDIGETPAGLVERVGEVGAVHDGIGAPKRCCMMAPSSSVTSGSGRR